jgi:hypothetical protein
MPNQSRYRQTRRRSLLESMQMGLPLAVDVGHKHAVDVELREYASYTGENDPSLDAKLALRC